MKEYTLIVGGVEHTVQAPDDETAALYGFTEKTAAKAAAAPRNKQAKAPADKANAPADTDEAEAGETKSGD